MKALITGASSGIGRDMARILAERGVELVLVARRRERLEKLQNELRVPVTVEVCDLSDRTACVRLYETYRNAGVDILVNNAGYGLFGPFDETTLEDELRLVDTNVAAAHILTKLFLIDFKRRGSGYLLNVASSAGFLPGPLLSSYYASKAYLLRYTEALYEELRRAKSSVSVSVFCPGPVDTEFNEKAGVRFSLRGLTSERAARAAIRGMFAKKPVIVPGFGMQAALFGARFLTEKALVRVCYRMQKRKEGDR